MKTVPDTKRTGGCIGDRTKLDISEEEKICYSCQESNSGTESPQPIHYIDYRLPTDLATKFLNYKHQFTEHHRNKTAHEDKKDEFKQPCLKHDKSKITRFGRPPG
jgi:hypothetical protein